MSSKKLQSVQIKNRRAQFDYHVLKRFTAGLVLYGTEIKSIRAGKAGLADTYCLVQGGEVWVKNMYIAEYAFGSFRNHAPLRERKLLLNRREIRELANETKSPGITIVPLLLYINEKGLAKLDIALCRGKHDYDKRQGIKEREAKREMGRAFHKSY
ncbi:MAG: SsrA-binding protein SmpB [Bacteroidaceae bacterium]|nr:SsrA-binding protein SmpB [Bacteroidaceae bacterium]MBR7029522.1 SsrA-binding protein SmpB [Bacteroidaceae bacterium]